MNIVNPFMESDFKSWVLKFCDQARVAYIVQFNDGRTKVCGNPAWAVKALTDQLNATRRKSMDWVPSVENLTLMELPLGDIKMKTPMMKRHAALVLRHFIGQKTQYGSGECMLWEHQVKVDSLKYSKEMLATKWDGPILSLQDIIPWENFKVKSFGNKIREDAFSIPLVWRALCLLIIEVG